MELKKLKEILIEEISKAKGIYGEVDEKIEKARRKSQLSKIIARMIKKKMLIRELGEKRMEVIQEIAKKGEDPYRHYYYEGCNGDIIIGEEMTIEKSEDMIVIPRGETSIIESNTIIIAGGNVEMISRGAGIAAIGDSRIEQVYMTGIELEEESMIESASKSNISISGSATAGEVDQCAVMTYGNSKVLSSKRSIIYIYGGSTISIGRGSVGEVLGRPNKNAVIEIKEGGTLKISKDLKEKIRIINNGGTIIEE